MMKGGPGWPLIVGGGRIVEVWLVERFMNENLVCPPEEVSLRSAAQTQSGNPQPAKIAKLEEGDG